MKLSIKNIFKILIIVILLAVAIFAVVFLVGNKTPGQTNKWNPDLIQANLPETTETSNSYGVKSNTNTYFDGSELCNRSYINKGLLVIKSPENYIGFYSLHYNKYLLERQYYAEWLDYNIVADSSFGYFINLRYKDVTYLYDSMGNLVYEGENKVVNILSTTPSDTTYVVLTLDNQEKLAYEYSNNGIPTSYPDANVILNPNNQSEDLSFDVDDNYVDIRKLDLAEYGKDGYYLSTSDRIYMFFSADNKLVSSHHVPMNATAVKYFGDSLVYQQMVKMPDDSSNYDFSIDGAKYQLTTTKFNAFNGGSVEKINAKFLLSSSELYKDLEGDHTLLLATITSIDNKKVASEQKVVVLDSNLQIIKELTGFEPKSFIKIGDNYYNDTTKILYNSKLEEICYLGGIKPDVNAENGVIVGSISGLYGMLDSNGTVKIPFEYESLNSDIYKDITIGVKEGEHYFLNISSGEAVKAEGTLKKLANGLFLNTTEEAIKLVNYTSANGISDYVELSDLDNQGISSKGLNANSFNNATYYFVETYTKDEGFTTYKYYSFVLNNFAKSEITTQGSQLYADVLDGTSFNEATEIFESSTPSGVHQTGNSYNYVKFVPTTTGTYTLSVLSADNISVSTAYEEIDYMNYQNVYLYKSWENEEGNKNFTFDLQKDKTYYIEYNNSTDAYFTFTLTKENGSNEEAPALVDIIEKETAISAKANSEKFYRIYSNLRITLDIASNGAKVYDYDEYYNDYKSTISSLSLDAGQTKTIVICGSITQNTTVTLTADIDGYAYGSSKLDSISLSDGSAISLISMPSAQLTSYRYLTYKNTGNTNKTINFYSTSPFSVKYSRLDFDTETTSISELTTEIIVEPNETIYFTCSLEGYSSGSAMDIAIISKEETVSKGTLGLATQFTPDESGEYKLEFISEYKNIECNVFSETADHIYYQNEDGLYELTEGTTYHILGLLPIGLQSDLLESGIELNIHKKQGTVTVSSDDSDAGAVSTALTVTFNSKGGSAVASQTVTSTTHLEYPEIPTKADHVFTGWYTELECSNLYNFNSTINGHLTLYAGWKDVTEYDGYDYEIVNAYQYTQEDNAYVSALKASPKTVYTTCLTGGNTRIYYWGSSGYRLTIYNETQQKYIKSPTSVSNLRSWFYAYSSVNVGDIISITYSQDYNASSPTFKLYFETSLPESEYGFASSEVDLFDDETVTVTATPNEGYEFLGWYVNDTLYSTETTLTYKPTTLETAMVAKWTVSK